MSVLVCSRNGCMRIMCERYSNSYGYICDECFAELVQLGITTSIETFMRSNKAPGVDTDMAAAYFAKEFPCD